jgi:pimeloyl-ACP methyl ester carboxylesterase
MSRSFVDVPGGRLLVVDEGSGPPIVLLHAGIADLRSWDAMVPWLITAGYRTVRCDQRGVGGSTTDEEQARLEANAPNARTVIWPDVAHMIGMEQPKRLAAAIIDFLAPLERWS